MGAATMLAGACSPGNPGYAAVPVGVVQPAQLSPWYDSVADSAGGKWVIVSAPVYLFASGRPFANVATRSEGESAPMTARVACMASNGTWNFDAPLGLGSTGAVSSSSRRPAPQLSSGDASDWALCNPSRFQPPAQGRCRALRDAAVHHKVRGTIERHAALVEDLG